MSFRVDLLGREDDEPERIGILFDSDANIVIDKDEDQIGALVELTPEAALELAAQLGSMYALHRRWLDAREVDPVEDDGTIGERLPRGLDVEGWRLKALLDAGYELGAAERLARSSVDLHAAVVLAKDAGPKLAAKILT